MADAGFHRIPLPLDPTAHEFKPTYLYYPLLPPPPPPTFAAFIVPAPFPALPPTSTVPTRALLLTSVPTNVSESTVRRELEVFGDVRAVQMERLRHGIVTVHFYDLRHATEAVNTIQQQHMQQQRRIRQHFDALTLSSDSSTATPPPPLPIPARGLLAGRVIWAQFTFPFAAGLPDRYNQGTVVITSDSNVSTRAIRDTFEAFGDVKEIREPPSRRNNKFVEFYNTRDATKAVAAVNGQEIDGKQVVVEFIHPGGGHKLNNNNNNYNNKNKQNKLTPDNPRIRSPPCKKDLHGVVEYGVYREVNDVNVNSPRGGGGGGGGGGLKKNVNNVCNVYKQQQQPGQWCGGGGGGGGRRKPWKGPRYNHRGKCDPRFSIKGDDESVVSSIQDSRTTVMIKNIPNKYSLKLLLNMLDNHCIQCNEGDNQQPLSSYDFVYLPIDFVNKCNVGYGFVNMTSPEATWRLYKTFNHHSWELFNSKKICEISYARLQGLETLSEHFKNSRFPCEVEEYMPVVFTPPRDGRTVTEPIPVVGRTGSSTAMTMTSSRSEEVGDGDDDDDVTEGGSYRSCSCNSLLAAKI